jgi:hypothetical protein
MRRVLASALSAVTCGRTRHGLATLATLRARSCGRDRLTGGVRVAMHSKRTAALIASLAVALAACGGDDDVEPIAEPTPTETAAPTEEPEPEEPDETEDLEPEDPFAIPDEIDEPYVQSVLDELFALRTEALKLTLAETDATDVDDEALAILRATHGVPARVEYADQLFRYLQEPNAEEAFLPVDEMGQTRYQVLRILRADESCIVLTGSPDLSEVAVEPGEEQWSVTSLGRLDSADDEGGRNSTPWVIFSGRQLTFEGEAPAREDVEEATLEELEGLIELPCGDAGASS